MYKKSEAVVRLFRQERAKEPKQEKNYIKVDKSGLEEEELSRKLLQLSEHLYY